MKYVFSVLILMFIYSCGVAPEKRVESRQESLKYAKGFTIGYCDGYTVVEVKNPWDTGKLLQRYVLVDKSIDIPDSLPEGTLVRVPLERVGVFNTVHCGLIDKFGLSDRIVGVCDSEYISVPSVKRRVESKEIINLGTSSKPNFEMIVSSNPEALIVSPFQNQGYGNILKLGVPIIECVSYMEQLPLGQAEWMKFHALFFGVKDIADSMFNAIENSYITIKDSVSKVEKRPSVLPEQRYGQTWWVPAGESYAANLYNDAGADYIWKNTEGTGSLALSFENVLDKAQKADVWLIRYNNADNNMTYGSLRANYDSYGEFDAFKNKKIFGCNTALVPYYDNSLFSTDTILMDLAKIFHPELFKDYSFTYYKPLD